MKINEVPRDIKREVYKRDEFTCRYCGNTIPWTEVEMVYDVPPDKGGKLEPSNLLTVCSRCIWEGKTGPIPEEEKKKVLSLIRELISYTNIREDVIFEEDYEQEVLNLNSKVGSLKEDIRKLSMALQEKEKMAIAYKKKMDRAYQDMENLRRRMESDIEMKVREGTRSHLMSMISTLDNLERAVEDAKKNDSSKDVANIISGLEFIIKGMLDQLAMKGVTMIDASEQPFDPRLHEAVGSLENKDILDGTVVEVRQKGFLQGDHVLRPARVVVSRGGPKRERDEPKELEEFELDENGGEEEDKVVKLEPWKPGVEIIDDDQEDGEDYVVAKPRKKH